MPLLWPHTVQTLYTTLTGFALGVGIVCRVGLRRRPHDRLGAAQGRRRQRGDGMKSDGMRPALTSVAVFCGSNFGTAPEHAAAAAQLGRLIAQRGLALVYGGTKPTPARLLDALAAWTPPSVSKWIGQPGS